MRRVSVFQEGPQVRPPDRLLLLDAGRFAGYGRVRNRGRR